MANDQTALNDPPVGSWDSLFKETTIHGVLKVAGSDAGQVETKLQAILKVLQHGTVTLDVVGTPPATVNSRIDGHTRPKPFRGKEQ